MGRFVRLNGEERRAVRDQLRELKEKLGAGPPPEEQDDLYRRKKPRKNRDKKSGEAKKEGEDKPDGKKELDPGIVRIIRICFYASLTAVLLGIAAAIVTGRGHGRAFLSFVYRRLESAIIKVMSRISGRDKKSMEEKDYASTLIKPLFNWKIVLLAVSITIVMRIVTGIGINLLYRSLGVELPVIVNIFVNTLLFYT